VIVKSAVSGEGANPSMWHQNAALNSIWLDLLPHAELEVPHPRNCRPAGTWKLSIHARPRSLDLLTDKQATTAYIRHAGLKEAASDGHRQAAMMNRVTVSGLRLLRPAVLHPNSTSTVAALPSKKALIPSCRYATQHQQSGSAAESRRRSVTPFNDDGHVPWTELSAGEKTARAAQQTFNFGMVIVGLVLTVCPIWLVHAGNSTGTDGSNRAA
jgi:hypothetical protein